MSSILLITAFAAYYTIGGRWIVQVTMEKSWYYPLSHFPHLVV